MPAAPPGAVPEPYRTALLRESRLWIESSPARSDRLCETEVHQDCANGAALYVRQNDVRGLQIPVNDVDMMEMAQFVADLHDELVRRFQRNGAV